MKTITILSGSSGWIGGELLRNSAYKANFVECASRGTPSSTKLVANLQSVSFSDQLLEQYNKLKLNAHTFIHCAGLAHYPDETNEVKRTIRDTNDSGTARVVEFCIRAGIERLIYISTIAAYDWEKRLPVREIDPVNPKSEYARSKLSGESHVLTAPLDGRVVRLATVFGTGDTANFLRLSRALKKRRFILPGSGKARKSVIPVDIAANLILAFARIDSPRHKLINLALPDAPSLRIICDQFSNSCNFQQVRSVPIWVLRMGALIGDQLNKFRSFPITSSTLHKLKTSTWVDTTRMQEVFPDLKLPSFNSCLAKHSDYYRRQ